MTGNEWYIYMPMPIGEPLYWSSRMNDFTALWMRGSYYKTEKQAQRVFDKLVGEYPGRNIRIGRLGT